MTYEQFLDWLLEQDADIVLSMLNLETEEILEKFDERAYQLWEQEYKEDDQ